MRRRQLLSLLLLAVLLPLAVLVSLRARDRMVLYREVEGLCAATGEGRWDDALAFDASLVAATPAGLRAAECRCRALIGQGLVEECVELTDAMLADPASGNWLPSPLVAAILVEDLRHRGELSRAAQLAHRANRQYAGELLLLLQELNLRRQLGEEAEVLAELRPLLPRAGKAEPPLRLELAKVHLQRKEWSEALELLGSSADDMPDRDSWYTARLRALAGAGDEVGLLEAAEEWRRAGGRPAEVDGLYALLLSYSQLLDPRGRHPNELLLAAAEALEDSVDIELALAVWQRLVGSLSVHGDHDRALVYLDRAVEIFGDRFRSSREDLLRSASQRQLGEARLLTLRGVLHFEVPVAEAGDHVWLSPDPTDEVDAPYQALPVTAGEAVVAERGMGTWPQRWVLTDAAKRPRAAGTVWPNPQEPVEVRVERREPLEVPPSFEPPATSAAGRERLFVVILDCADWRFVEYGRMLGVLPVMDHLVREGYRAVLDSEPPLTAIALNRLLHPHAEAVEGVLGMAFQIGAEIEGLNFVGRNPFAALSWLLPGAADLFTTLGSTELRAVNMLHSVGGVRAGRHGRVSGPFGAEGEVKIRQTARPLEAGEHALLAPLLIEVSNRQLLEEMAADFDALVELAEDPAYDLLVLRVASLDLLTHGSFPSAVRTGQDDGELPLLTAYRYADQRLGELWSRLDGNDALIVMSDHGIRTALEHDRRALFLAAGGRVAPGRAEGRPVLRGFGRAVADFFGVAAGWPATGIEPWVPTMTGSTAVDDAAFP